MKRNISVMPSVTVAVEPIALSLVNASQLVGCPAWTLQEAIWRGALPARWAGRQRIILLSDLRNWVASLEFVEPSVPPSLLARKQISKS